MKTNHELQNVSATASRVGVPVKWLREKALVGKIPCLKISKSRLLFNIEAVKQALLDLAAEGNSDE